MPVLSTTWLRTSSALSLLPASCWPGWAAQICSACSWYLRQRNHLNVPVAAANLSPYKEQPCIWWSLRINSHPEGRLMRTGYRMPSSWEMALLGEGSSEPFPAKVFGVYSQGIKCHLGQSLENLGDFAVPLPTSPLPLLTSSAKNHFHAQARWTTEVLLFYFHSDEPLNGRKIIMLCAAVAIAIQEELSRITMNSSAS